jgi:hypothetical protein
MSSGSFLQTQTAINLAVDAHGLPLPVTQATTSNMNIQA